MNNTTNIQIETPRPVGCSAWLGEWHYAPLTGAIGKYVNGEAVPCVGWGMDHEWTKEFLDARAAGEIHLTKTVEHGHAMFHGHRGRVDVYSPNDPS